MAFGFRIPGSATHSEMRDEFRFAAPLGPLGRIVEWLVLRPYMAALLHECNQVIKQIAESESWRDYLPVPAAYRTD